ncbi:MAG: hypothetical protein J6M21_00400 [Campylobacter sp.]|nr:hypothetical protein [Campylobacter sp.]
MGGKIPFIFTEIIPYIGLFVFIVLVNLIYKKKIKFSKTNMERFNKIKNSEIYQRFIGRALLSGKAISLLNLFLYFIIFVILNIVFITAIDVKPKPESEWYRTDGVMIKVYTKGTNRSDPFIEILSNNGEKIKFRYAKNNNIKESLQGQKATIYSQRFLDNINEPRIAKLIDENGTVLISPDMYDYKSRLQSYNDILSYKPFLICLFILLLIYLINGNKNSNKNKNLSQTKHHNG